MPKLTFDLPESALYALITGDGTKVFVDQELHNPIVICTTSDFRLRSGEVMTDPASGRKLRFLSMLGQQGNNSYLLCHPID